MDPQEELAKIQVYQKLAHHKRVRWSKLHKYRIAAHQAPHNVLAPKLPMLPA